jgi:hypothetical protein
MPQPDDDTIAKGNPGAPAGQIKLNICGYVEVTVKDLGKPAVKERRPVYEIPASSAGRV